MKIRVRLLASFAALTLGLIVIDGYAQFGGTGGIFGGSRGGHGSRSPRDGNENQKPIRSIGPDVESPDVIEYRLSQLEDSLQLKPEQQKVWDSFAEKVRAYAGDLSRARARNTISPSAASPQGDGIHHIEQAADTARNQATALDEIADAAKSLYASFTATQRQLADQRIATIIAPPRRASPDAANISSLPDLGSSPAFKR